MLTETSALGFTKFYKFEWYLRILVAQLLLSNTNLMRALDRILFAALLIAPGSLCIAQKAVSLSSAVERQFNKIESDIVSAAESMPESKYYFTPDSLYITGSDFKGVRTFAGQLMHLATDNILIWSAITGDPVRNDITDVNGPTTIKTKADVIQYLKASFSIGRKAMASLTDKNAMDMIDFRYRKLSRLDLMFYALTHDNDHYGQIVVYLRMCGILPPPST